MARMQNNLNKTLLVTGGGRGIGAATALRAAREGYDVALNFSRDRSAAAAVADRIRASGRRAGLLQADVGDEAAVMSMFASEGWPPLGALVNNAGVVDLAARVDEMSGDRLRRMFNINVLGSLYCAREALLRMSRRHGGAGGAIVNLSSVAATLGAPGQYVDYAASKGAIDSFTLGLAREVATEGVRVNGVRPGIIETDIHASGGQPDRAQRMAPLVPMQRAGSADEVAAAIVWLLSEEASYTTGTILDVSGGR
jgi:NAD(P)-dependent dehydrogenase (short-subunit alcohol dehydrogenase family)